MTDRFLLTTAVMRQLLLICTFSLLFAACDGITAGGYGEPEPANEILGFRLNGLASEEAGPFAVGDTVGVKVLLAQPLDSTMATGWSASSGLEMVTPFEARRSGDSVTVRVRAAALMSVGVRITRESAGDRPFGPVESSVYIIRP